MSGILWQAAVVADSQAVQTATGAPHDAAAELVVKNPVPGIVGQAFQFAFNLPSWVQWGGAIVGAIVGLVILVWIYGRRDTIFAWLGQQSTAYKAGLAGVAAVMLLGAGGVGYATNHYMQHDNDFCVGCHVMGDAWGAFQRSEHRKLECHSCHRQSIFVSMNQLVSWVAEKPQDIPKHAKVPTNVCKECHAQNVSDSSWKRIVATAGHRLHMNSDSSALKGVACVTCHGQEVHRFKPVDKTCGQTDCHATKDTKIVLGKMAGQTSQHCTGCHTFTRVVPENISMDSTRKFLVANGSPESCFGCHEMQNKLKGFQAKDDRGHAGVCGTCHNPHKQTEPKQAFESCATAGCHADMSKTNKMHAGLPAHAAATCGECHKAHEWKAIGRECIDCHKGIFDAKPARKAVAPARSGDAAGAAAGVHSGAAAPGDVPAALRPIAYRPRPDNVPATRRATQGTTHRGRAVPVSRRGYRARASARSGPAWTVVRRQAATPPPAADAPASILQQPPKDSPSFSHRTHKVLACTGCHNDKTTHGTVNVRRPSECAACHHSPERSVSCEGCHDLRTKLNKTLMRPVAMRTSAATPARQRTLSFVHKDHRDLDCKGCHSNGIMLGVAKDCQSCHTDHHKAESSCTSCHQTPPKTAHVRAAHDGCAGSGCHTDATVLALPPTRSACLACHTDQANHKPKRECAECHAVAWGTAASKPR